MQDEKAFYGIDDVDMSRRIEVKQESFVEGIEEIHYENDDGTELLFVTNEELGEALVEGWNDAIGEEKRVAGLLEYHSGINAKASKELDQKDDRIKELLRLCKFGRQGMSRQTDLIKGLHDQITTLTAYRDQLYDHLRAILDAQMPSEDNDETEAARQLLCDESDIEKSILEEGYKKEE